MIAALLLTSLRGVQCISYVQLSLLLSSAQSARNYVVFTRRGLHADPAHSLLHERSRVVSKTAAAQRLQANRKSSSLLTPFPLHPLQCSTACRSDVDVHLPAGAKKMSAPSEVTQNRRTRTTGMRTHIQTHTRVRARKNWRKQRFE